jgi:hypothetical protein
VPSDRPIVHIKLRCRPHEAVFKALFRTGLIAGVSCFAVVIWQAGARSSCSYSRLTARARGIGARATARLAATSAGRSRGAIDTPASHRQEEHRRDRQPVERGDRSTVDAVVAVVARGGVKFEQAGKGSGTAARHPCESGWSWWSLCSTTRRARCGCKPSARPVRVRGNARTAGWATCMATPPSLWLINTLALAGSPIASPILGDQE